MWPFRNVKKKIKTAIAAKETFEDIEIDKMANKLKQVLYSSSKEIIFLCIGSDRSTGDSLGPIVGTMLKEKKIPYPVYGTLQEPVHALNIKKVLKEIYNKYDDPFIFGIDACLGNEREIGSIKIEEGAFQPGNALHKSLPSVGNYHMKAIVNYLNPWSPMEMLNSTRMYTIFIMADIITKIIIKAVFCLPKKQLDTINKNEGHISIEM